jgi:5'-3' exonuclease
MLSAIIDANAMGHADHHGTLLTVGKFQTQAVFGTVKRMRDLAGKFPDARFTALWDGKAQFRYEAFPEYKANRVATSPEQQVEKDHYQAQVPLIRAVYKALGIPQIVPESLEADDLAGYLARVHSRTGQVILFTGDSDWWQMVNENTICIDPRGAGKTVTLNNFHEMTGYFTPDEYIEGKALVGDSADGIPPVGGIGKKGAPVFMAQFRSVENFWKQCDEGTFVPKTLALKGLWKGDARKNWERNMKLMVLGEKPPASKIDVITGPVNEGAFRAICERLSFISILKNFDNYMLPFRERKVT